ncbi:hypothetical protein L7F22_038865 [Adiantum nelumboides]|nr:hypothetical protein [Adiantum nelumboides]
MSSATITEDVQDGLTNKEKRLARKAEKQAARKSGTKDDEKKRKQEEASLEENVETINEEEDEEKDDEEEEDVEALSHKERRKRRKLEKQAAKHGEQEEGQTGEGDAFNSTRTNTESDNKVEKEATTQRSLFSLWVGNLSFQTSPTRLQEWFEQHDLFGITRVYMPKGARKFEYNRGFAYVDVPSEEEVKQGIALSEVNLDGRRLLIKSGSDFGGRPTIDAAARALAEGNMAASTGDEQQNGLEGVIGKKGKTGLTKTAQKILRSQKHPPGPTLFIGNLSFNATEEGVRDMIERSAASRFEHESARASNIVTEKKNDAKKGTEEDVEEENAESSAVEVAEESKKETTARKPELLRGAGIRKIRMGEFEDTGKCKGFAFIDFHSPSYATATLIDPRNGHLDGRELILQYAGAEAIRRGAPKGKMGERPQGQKRPYGGGERRQQSRRAEEDREKLVESAPAPGTFDIDQPLPKKHKETKEERIQRREAEKADRKISSTRRLKPGAALASAQRGKVAIDIDAPQGKKKTFGDDEDA